MHDISSNLHEESEVNRLPSLPHVLIRLLQACRDDRVCFDTITEIINKDVALSAKVIAVANSPFYGHIRHQNNLKHIVLALGLDTIKSIAITASVQQFFSRYSNKKIHFLKQFWRHALGCATVARSLARLTSYKYIEEAYLAGLLHDIGKLVLVNHAGVDYSDLAHGAHPADELLILENKNFNIGHDELGARLLSRWDVTDSICDAVRFHHKPVDEIQSAHQLVKILNLANILSSDNILNNPARVECAASLFDLSDAIVREIVIQSGQEVVTVARSMNIDIGSVDNMTDGRDEQKHIELAQEVRDIALSRSGKFLANDDKEEAVYLSIQKSILMLFGIRDSLIFRCDEDLRTISSAYENQVSENSLINDLVIPYESGSLLSAAVKSCDITDTFQIDKLTVVDRQIVGGLKSDGFVCIPAVQDEQIVALLVMGVNTAKYAWLSKNQKLMKLFSQDAAGQIGQHIYQARMREEIVNNSHRLYKDKAREIIHETNNPLGVIRNYLQLLAQRLDAGDPAQEEIKIIKDEIDRVGTIILRCADEIDHDAAVAGKQGILVNDLVRDINNIFRASLYITHNVKSNLNLASSAGYVHAGKNIVKQIITNIIKNAVESMQGGGVLDIATRSVNINGRYYVDIEIRDNGPGISEEVMQNLYSPVTSTKGKGHSGLGLSIVKNLMDSIGGIISCRTSQSGAIFNVQIPGEINK